MKMELSDDLFNSDVLVLPFYLLGLNCLFPSAMLYCECN